MFLCIYLLLLYWQMSRQLNFLHVFTMTIIFLTLPYIQLHKADFTHSKCCRACATHSVSHMMTPEIHTFIKDHSGKSDTIHSTEVFDAQRQCPLEHLIDAFQHRLPTHTNRYFVLSSLQLSELPPMRTKSRQCFFSGAQWGAACICPPHTVWVCVWVCVWERVCYSFIYQRQFLNVNVPELAKEWKCVCSPSRK